MKTIRATVPMDVIKQDSDGNGLPDDEAIFVVSNEGVDRDGQSIVLKEIDRTSFRQNPVVLWTHNIDEIRPPIGSVINDYEDSKGNLIQHVRFDMEDEFAALICRKVKKGFIKACSIGGRVIEFARDEKTGATDYSKVLRMEQAELSIAPIGKHRDALVLAKAWGIDENDKEMELLKKNYTEPGKTVVDTELIMQQYDTALSLTKALGDAIAEVNLLGSKPDKASGELRKQVKLAKSLANSTRQQTQTIIITLAEGLKGN